MVDFSMVRGISLRVIRPVFLLFALALPTFSQTDFDECERVAASPDEPGIAAGAGVPLGKIDTVKAIPACTSAQVPGDPTYPVVSYRLARVYMANGPMQDIRSSLYLMRTASGAMYWSDALGADVAEWYKAAGLAGITPATYEAAARSGDVVAQIALGWLYSSPNLSALSSDAYPEQGLEWMQMAASQGFPLAQYYLATLLAFQDRHDEAFPLYKAAAEQGSKRGLFMLGFSKLGGLGTQQDVEGGMAILSNLALQGDVWAQITLGKEFAAGRFVPKDDASARYWYQMAADGGSQEAKNLLKDLSQVQAMTDDEAMLALAGAGIVLFVAGAALTYDPDATDADWDNSMADYYAQQESFEESQRQIMADTCAWADDGNPFC
jgi:TPR repeat protein